MILEYKKKILIIILPKNDNSSPIKGAIALANYLCKFIQIKIIFLNPFLRNNTIDKRIEVYTLKSKFFKILHLNKILKNFKNFEINTLSYCLSADLANFLIKSNVKNISTSVRGNLIKAYLSTYGLLGFIIAKFHYFLIGKFDKIFSMNNSMYNQIKYLTNRKSIIVGNCIDENKNQKFFKRKKKFQNKIIFMGNLDKNKNPLLLIRGFQSLSHYYPQAELIILGDGPLKKKIIKIKKDKKLKKLKILGKVKNPIKYLVNSDLLISTSKSEGISRSVLEALYYGIPVMTSNVDGANEIIKKFKSGYVFKNDNDFLLNLKKIIDWSRTVSCKKRKCLLPYNLRQNFVCRLYLKHLF